MGHGNLGGRNWGASRSAIWRLWVGLRFNLQIQAEIPWDGQFETPTNTLFIPTAALKSSHSRIFFDKMNQKVSTKRKAANILSESQGLASGYSGPTSARILHFSPPFLICPISSH